MAGVLDNYGYNDDTTKLIPYQTFDEAKQSKIDEEQNKKIEKNRTDNVEQQEEIDKNTLINDAQQVQIDDLEEKIQHISGGTIEDLDMGEWNT